MSVSAINGPAQTTVPSGVGNGSQSTGGDDGFARMLQGSTEKAAPNDGKTSSDPRPASGDTTTGQVEGKQHDASRKSTSTRTTDASADSEDSAPGDTAAIADGASATTTDTASDAASAGDGWPPPGLASLLDPAALAPPASPVPPALSLSLAGMPAATAANDPAPTTGAAATSAAVLAMPTATSTTSRPVEPAAIAAPNAPESGAIAMPAVDVDAAADAAPEPAPSTFGFVLHAASSTAPAAGTSAANALPVSAPHAPTPQLHSEGFADDIGTHVQWLAGQKISHAHIRISPQDLGPVEVRLQLDGDRISADFSSAQPEVRQALESTLPRLREMLGQHGFELAHAGVGQQSRQDGGQAATTPGGSADGGEATEETATPVVQRLSRRGLLDAYA